MTKHLIIKHWCATSSQQASSHAQPANPRVGESTHALSMTHTSGKAQPNCAPQDAEASSPEGTDQPLHPWELPPHLCIPATLSPSQVQTLRVYLLSFNKSTWPIQGLNSYRRRPKIKTVPLERASKKKKSISHDRMRADASPASTGSALPGAVAPSRYLLGDISVLPVPSSACRSVPAPRRRGTRTDCEMKLQHSCSLWADTLPHICIPH